MCRPGRALLRLCLAGLALAAAGDAPLAQRTIPVSPAGLTAIDPDITRDGGVIAFVLAGQAWIVRSDGSGLEALPPTGITNLALNGDGSRLGLVRNSRETLIYERSTGDLLSVGPLDNLDLVDFSADGSRLIFGYLPYMTVAGDGSGLLSLMSTSDHYSGPELSGEGSRFVYVDTVCVPQQSGSCEWNQHVLRSEADGTGITRLTYETGIEHVRPDVSEDGSVVLFQFWPEGQYDGLHLGAVDGDGTDERHLTSQLRIYPPFKTNLTPWCLEGCETSDLSGDGTTAVFSTQPPRWEPLIPGGIFVVRPDGTGLRQIGYGGPNVAINRDGSIVAFIQADPDNAQRVMAAGLPGFLPPEMDGLVFGADGRTLSWTSSPLANSHNLYRGAIADLRSGRFGDCLAGSIAVSTASDATLPAEGDAYFYLVTGENGTGEGTAGLSSDLVVRVPALSCPPADSDADAVPDVTDSCPFLPNPSQANADGDAPGDLCDRCPTVADDPQIDRDSDRISDACEQGEDPDGDGLLTGYDNCPTVSNPNQQDSDGDGRGNACDSETRDQDGDGLADSVDNCPDAANPSQSDLDGNGRGDACDPADWDGDGVANRPDNCPTIPNPAQADGDADGLGDACEAE